MDVGRAIDRVQNLLDAADQSLRFGRMRTAHLCADFVLERPQLMDLVNVLAFNKAASQACNDDLPPCHIA